MGYILDALDLETFIICKDEEEGKRLAMELVKQLGFEDTDLVFIQHSGPGARVRVRATVHRPGDEYQWLKNVNKSSNQTA